MFTPVYSPDADDTSSFTITGNYEGTGSAENKRTVQWLSITYGPVDTTPPYSGNTWIIDEEKPVDWKAIKSLRREATLINAFDIMREHQNFRPSPRIPVNQKFKWRGSRV